MSDAFSFRLLRYIKVSAETLNFTRAAEQVFVAQSSLSHQIGKLEDSIEILIFDRLQGGLRVTPAGRLVTAFADKILRDWEDTLVLARAVQAKQVPPLRVGFSSFVTSQVLERLHRHYEGIFGSKIVLVSCDPKVCLERLNAGTLDCGIQPLPIEGRSYCLQQITRAPLWVCMRGDDPLASRTEIRLCELGTSLTVFRDPEQFPSAHSRLLSMFNEYGLPLNIACIGRTPSEIQWMVRQRYGLALLDALLPLDPDLVARPLADVDWTAETAFVHLRDAEHVALPYVDQFFGDLWKEFGGRKKPSQTNRPEQISLLA